MLDVLAPPAMNIATSRPVAWQGDGRTSRIDLHVHSHASGYAQNWWVRGLGLGIETRESYTTPDEAWTRAREAGMDFITLTDHESLDGASELRRHPTFLQGVEVNARFPDDGSIVDVLIYGFTAEDHREIQARRHDVYALLDHLREADLVYVLAHPLFDLGGRIGPEQVEKRLVLFPIWEVINGARPAAQNQLAARIAAAADRPTLRAIARRHGLRRPDHEVIRGTAGSDDHGGLHIGRAWTSFPQISDVPDLLNAMRAGEMTAAGESGSVAAMAPTAFANAARAIAEHPELPAGTEQFGALRELLPLVPHFSSEQVRQLLAGRYEARMAQSFPSGQDGFPSVQVLTSIGKLVEGHLMIAPYVAVHGYFGRERRKSEELAREMGLAEPTLRVGVAVDDLDEIHGVATMYRNLERVARGHSQLELTLLRCLDGPAGDPASPQLRPMTTLPLPLYPGRVLGVPSILDVLDHLDAASYDVVHIATPGPLGIATLFAASTLGTPTVGAYHTEFAAYARALSGDHLLADLVEGFVREFYRRCSTIAVPSHATASALRARGFGEHITVLRNGVDSTLMSPARRDEELHGQLGQGRKLLFYVGRVSKEKDLGWLAEGFQALLARRDDVHLVVVGDGPYREEFAEALAETATFTGFLASEELARTIASCDLFLFPSTTDTLGRAVIEAQACGVPAIVRDAGGAPECLEPGISGIVVPAGDSNAYWEAVELLLDDEPLRRSMGPAARRFAATRTWEEVLEGFLALVSEVAGRSSEPGQSAAIQNADLVLAS